MTERHCWDGRSDLRAAIIISFLATLAAGHKFTDSFPAHDEYDFAILDPDTQFGSPYGGFGRAAASRLASMPLHLPNVGLSLEDDEDFEDLIDPMHMQVRDVQGRLFACRVYHEDELEASTLYDSMFDVAKSKSKDVDVLDDSSSSRPKNSEEDEWSALGADESSSSSSSSPTSDPDDASEDGVEGTAKIDMLENEPGNKVKSERYSRSPVTLVKLVSRLVKLTEICAQKHVGWWSYEWCFEGSMTQFHVEVTKVSNNQNQLGVTDLTNLGTFHKRELRVFEEGSGSEDQKFAEGRKELAVVVDKYVGGDDCPETGDPRETLVKIRCCSQAKINRSKGGVLQNGIPMMTDLVSLADVFETEVCKYEVNVCSPLLCADWIDGVSKTDAPGSSSAGSDLQLPSGKELSSIETMSVREVLDVVYGKNHKSCVQSGGSGGWWTYQLCHGKHIRQYHEATKIDPMTGITVTEVDDEYILGKYDAVALEGFSEEEEWKFVVNVTSPSASGGGSSGAGGSQGTSKSIGNGAYFVQEYTRGDVCADPDVTDAAITAGAAGGRGIERASTVKYMCGPQFFMTVKEDSTCHYIVEVTIPALCHHPFFRAPTSKKQVMKCLPVVPSGP